MSLARGEFLNITLVPRYSWLPSILEYLSREDAERAVKELDGRDLRGQPVRVALDREVSCNCSRPEFILTLCLPAWS